MGRRQAADSGVKACIGDGVPVRQYDLLVDWCIWEKHSPDARCSSSIHCRNSALVSTAKLSEPGLSGGAFRRRTGHVTRGYPQTHAVRADTLLVLGHYRTGHGEKLTAQLRSSLVSRRGNPLKDSDVQPSIYISLVIIYREIFLLLSHQ